MVPMVGVRWLCVYVCVCEEVCLSQVLRWACGKRVEVDKVCVCDTHNKYLNSILHSYSMETILKKQMCNFNEPRPKNINNQPKLNQIFFQKNTHIPPSQYQSVADLLKNKMC